MSKFSEKLANLGQTAPARLGFGKAAARDKTPVMLIVGRSKQPRDIAGLADVLLLPDAPSEKGGAAWGVSAKSGFSLDAAQLKDRDCQFVLVEDGGTPASLLADEDLCRGFIVSEGLTDQQVRAIEDAPFEFLLYRPSNISWPLTVGTVMSLQEVVSSFSKHIFLDVADLPGTDDLEVLKQMPVSAIVVDLDSAPPEKLKALKEAVGKLEPRKHRAERTPLVPAAGRSSNDYDDDDGDDDYDDGWEDE